MKVILLQDVAKLGRRNQVVTVPDGRGLNQLIPQGYALPATPENVRRVEEMVNKRGQAAAAGDERFAELRAALAAEPLSVAAAANDQGHLFAALSAAKVTEALNARGFSIDGLAVSFPNPVKEVGTHEIVLSLHGEKATVALTVTAA